MKVFIETQFISTGETHFRAGEQLIVASPVDASNKFRLSVDATVNGQPVILTGTEGQIALALDLALNGPPPPPPPEPEWRRVRLEDGAELTCSRLPGQSWQCRLDGEVSGRQIARGVFSNAEFFELHTDDCLRTFIQDHNTQFAAKKAAAAAAHAARLEAAAAANATAAAARCARPVIDLTGHPEILALARRVEAGEPIQSITFRVGRLLHELAWGEVARLPPALMVPAVAAAAAEASAGVEGVEVEFFD